MKKSKKKNDKSIKLWKLIFHGIIQSCGKDCPIEKKPQTYTNKLRAFAKINYQVYTRECTTPDSELTNDLNSSETLSFKPIYFSDNKG